MTSPTSGSVGLATRDVRRDLLVMAGFTALYAPYVAHAAVTRAFWLDELFTFYIVTMPDWTGMFDLIRRGPDQNPPLFYVVTRLLVGCFGESEWVFRLPAMVGYWVLCVALYFLGRRLGGSPVGLVAMATPVLTAAVYYAGEARPYGLALGAVGFGAACRRLAEVRTWRPWATAGLAGGLGLAVALHYLALLPVAVLWVLEVIQSRRRRRVSWAIWGGLLSPLLVLALHWPWLHGQARLPFWKTALSWREVWDFYHWLLSPPECLWLALMVGGATVLAQRTALSPPACPNAYEWTAAGLSFALLPPIGWMFVLKLTGKTFFADRYLLATSAGLALLAAYPLRRIEVRHG
ncbi:MAG: glycosyltransferase family 39 protein [Chloracidobacterium sp.]|nr:glycosyltransferase family 39 protein [Chloracidobacterium sp.]MDW8218059.1 glycosyltransferase family 39 protein [Acidobacteriota bacterium]